MMSEKREPMTPLGHRQLVEELDYLKTVERPKNIKALEEARDHGDISENADYEAAKNQQGFIASRRAALEDRLGRAEVIDPQDLKYDSIAFGATVTLVDIQNDQEVVYQIVGSYEANPKKNTISFDSPLAKALIGKKEGDEAIVTTPNGTREFAISKIQCK